MAVAIHVYIRPKGAPEDSPIQVEHIFYGRDEAEADKIRLAHLAGCENFAAAEADDRVAEAIEDVADQEVPTWIGVSEEDDEEEDDDEEEEGE